MTGRSRWMWRGSVALLAVAVAFVIYPIVEGGNDIINSDWPVFATGARLLASDPAHLYDVNAQRSAESEITGGRKLVTLGINGILPFDYPAWVAFVALPFELLGATLGGKLWVLFGLACLALGLYLGVRPRPPSAILTALASVPTALLVLNAQISGLVVLGIGAAIALWSRPYLAGLCLGLTLFKPHLVLPAGAAVVLARQWKVLAGWAIAGVALAGAAVLVNPRWFFEWLPLLNGPVGPGQREVDFAHLGTAVPDAYRGYVVAVLSLVALIAVLILARRRRSEIRPAVAVLVAGGVLVAPHALPSDLVLVAAALAIWGEADWGDWVLLSVVAATAALTPAPVPAIAGVLLVGWVCLRAAGISSWRREPAAPSTG